MNESPLILEKDFTDDELKDIQVKIQSEYLVQFKVKLSRGSPLGDARAQLLFILATPDDVALEKFKKP